MPLLSKILWENKSKGQILGAVLGTFIGLLLLLGAWQLYIDVQAFLFNKDESDSRFIIINKKVNLFNTLGASSTFSEEELNTIKSQEFVDAIGLFTANRFKVSASSSMLGFYTELFFEAVPDEFLDVQIPRYSWSKGQKELPVILSRDYLALYNFGFAPSQGLPQFTPSTIKKVSVDITIAGNGIRKVFQGRIVGFSNRINSIIVPQNFMDWANKSYGSSPDKGNSRIMLSVDNVYSKALGDFIEKNNYEISSGKLIGGQLTSLLNLIISIIAVIGFIIVILSILVFVLNFQLIISRSARDISLLLQLGYKPQQISHLLLQKTIFMFAVVLVSSILFLFAVHYFTSNWLANQGVVISPYLHWSIFALAMIIALLFFIGNKKVLHKSVVKLYR